MDRIDVFSFARTGAQRAGEISLAAMPRLGASLVALDGMVHFHCVGQVDARGRPGVRLAIHACLPLRCDRCAMRLDLELDVERDFYFVRTEAELAVIAIDDAPEEALLGSVAFDLVALIEDEAILQLPISPRHGDCVPAAVAGRAGEPDTPPRPFAGLAGLRERMAAPEIAAAPVAPPAARRRRPGPD
jgi:uncharacterized protein